MAKIEALEQKIRDLESEVINDHGVKAQIIAKDKAIKAIERIDGGEMGPLPPVAWGLLWAEYFTRTKQYQFVGYDSRRTKGDKFGNSWSLEPLPNLVGLSAEHVEMFTALAESFGYDADAPPKNDYILLRCQPEKGAYDIAIQNLEKAQEAFRRSTKRAYEANKNLNEARARNNKALVEQYGKDFDFYNDEAKGHATLFNECKAIIENAVQRFYLVPMESFEKMDHYGMPIQCQTATVLPQKRHQDLTEYQAPLPEVVI